jgi:primosomal protein N'
MDVDSVRGKTAHDMLIKQFEQQRVNILVGTQMVIKGCISIILTWSGSLMRQPFEFFRIPGE